MKTFIPSKDAALEDSISYFQQQLIKLGFDIEEASWLNPVPNVWSVHIRDKSCGLCFTNGKGASQKAALASALAGHLSEVAASAADGSRLSLLIAASGETSAEHIRAALAPGGLSDLTEIGSHAARFTAPAP